MDDFLRVAKKILVNFKNVNFVFIGRKINTQKNYHNRIKNMHMSFDLKIRKKIKFYGMKKDVRKDLEKSDIFLCTSKSEGGPIAVWEAMSMELPVVSTNVGGTSQYIKSGYNGYLCKVGDINNLSKKIIKLITSFHIRKKFGIRSRKVVKNKLDANLITKKYERIYEIACSR